MWTQKLKEAGRRASEEATCVVFEESDYKVDIDSDKEDDKGEGEGEAVVASEKEDDKGEGEAVVASQVQ
jgi:hypothetical protein